MIHDTFDTANNAPDLEERTRNVVMDAFAIVDVVYELLSGNRVVDFLLW